MIFGPSPTGVGEGVGLEPGVGEGVADGVGLGVAEGVGVGVAVGEGVGVPDGVLPFTLMFRGGVLTLPGLPRKPKETVAPGAMLPFQLIGVAT